MRSRVPLTRRSGTTPLMLPFDLIGTLYRISSDEGTPFGGQGISRLSREFYFRLLVQFVRLN